MASDEPTAAAYVRARAAEAAAAGEQGVAVTAAELEAAGVAGADREGRPLAWKLGVALAALLLLAAVGVLAYIGWGYLHADEDYQDIAREAFAPPAELEEGQDAGAGGPVLSDLTVDWDYLRALNPEVVAWLYIPGTRVNYPIAQGPDNVKYLDLNFAQEGGFAARGGSIFMDAYNAPLMTDQNIVVYGHHMNDGSMFACLSKDYGDQAFFDEHRTVYLLTPVRNMRFEAFSLVRTDGADEIVEINFSADELRADYVANKCERSIVTPADGFPAPYSVQQMLTLSTCDYNESNGRAVLFCRLAEAAFPGAGAGSEVAEGDQQALDAGVAG